MTLPLHACVVTGRGRLSSPQSSGQEPATALALREPGLAVTGRHQPVAPASGQIETGCGIDRQHLRRGHGRPPRMSSQPSPRHCPGVRLVRAFRRRGPRLAGTANSSPRSSSARRMRRRTSSTPLGYSVECSATSVGWCMALPSHSDRSVVRLCQGVTGCRPSQSENRSGLHPVNALSRPSSGSGYISPFPKSPTIAQGYDPAVTTSMRGFSRPYQVIPR